MRGMYFWLAASALALSACATTEGSYRVAGADGGGRSVDRLFRNSGVDATRPQPVHAHDASQARLLATYDGVEGARAAHLVYFGAQAESLDGACESSVRVAQNETLYDIAELCDVELTALLDANPDVRNPRDVAGGRLVHVPGAPDPVRRSLVAAYLNAAQAPLHSLQSVPTTPYVTQPGDSLERISIVHQLREDRIANLNPGVDWVHLPAGLQLKLPATTVAAALAPAATEAPLPAKKRTKSESQDIAREDEELSDDEDVDFSDTGGSEEVTRLMPYRLGPKGAAANGQSGENGVLSVDQSFAKPGDTLTISGEGLTPNASVTISRGPNRGSLAPLRDIRTDASGAFNASVAVPADADAGGLIFRARVDDSGETLYSERIGVDTVKD